MMIYHYNDDEDDDDYDYFDSDDDFYVIVIANMEADIKEFVSTRKDTDLNCNDDYAGDVDVDYDCDCDRFVYFMKTLERFSMEEYF